MAPIEEFDEMEAVGFANPDDEDTEETDMDDIVARVKKVIEAQLGRKEEEITLGSSFVEDLGADSLDIVELVMGFEDEFGIDIPDEDVEQMRTVQDAVDYIGKKAGDG